MKKILALVLAAIMMFSLGVIGFAEGEEENTGILLPEFPTQTEGAIYFASENTYVEAGGVYEVPVYMVSNYTASAEGDVIVGLSLALTGEAYDLGLITMTDMKISAEAQALAGYETIFCDFQFDGDPTANWFAFKTSDMSILTAEKFPVAVVTVQVSPEYTGYNEEGEEMDCILDILAAQYFWYENAYMNAIGPVEIFPSDAQEIWEMDGWVDTLESIDFGTADVISGVYTVNGHFTVEPPVPTWGERLKAWAIEQAIKIITFFQGINEVLLGLLPTL